MAEAIYLASTLVMGLLIVGVVALMVRGRHWYQYTPQAAYGKLSAGGGGPGTAISRVASAPSVWMGGFLLLALGFMIGAIVVLSGGASMAGPAVMGALGAVVVVYFVGGVYIALRGNGRPTSQAVAASAAVFGGLFLLAVVVKLVLSG